jgi:hypothetical protein
MASDSRKSRNVGTNREDYMPTFATPIRVNKRIFFEKGAVDNYVRQLAGLPILDNGDVGLIPATKLADVLGVCRRTIGRRIVEAREAAARSEMGAAR